MMKYILVIWLGFGLGVATALMAPLVFIWHGLIGVYRDFQSSVGAIVRWSNKIFNEKRDD